LVARVRAFQSCNELCPQVCKIQTLCNLYYTQPDKILRFQEPKLHARLTISKGFSLRRLQIITKAMKSSRGRRNAFAAVGLARGFCADQPHVLITREIAPNNTTSKCRLATMTSQTSIEIPKFTSRRYVYPQIDECTNATPDFRTEQTASCDGGTASSGHANRGDCEKKETRAFVASMFGLEIGT
jgi:hypothetical protein